MQKTRPPLTMSALSFPIVLFALFSFAPAQRIASYQSQQVPSPAGREITITLRMSNSKLITVSQIDGEMIRTGPKGAGEMLGIIPHVLDNGSVSLDFYRIRKIIKRNVIVGEALTNIGSMVLDTKIPQYTEIDRIYTVELIGVGELPEQTGVRITDVEYTATCPCCVTCDGEETCAQTVQLSCGNCSCKP